MSKALAPQELARPGKVISWHVPPFKRYATPQYDNDSRFSHLAAVSLTGPWCGLGCDHCRGRVLTGMAPALTPRQLWNRARRLRELGGKALLVSSGSDLSGLTRLRPFIPALADIKQNLGLRLLVHTGLVDDVTARELAAAGVDLAMLDIIGDGETIRQVCHLNRTPDDFEASLAALCRHGVPVAPHVVVGMHWGRIRGEWAALERIRRFPVVSLVLVLFTPFEGTPMEGAAPPALREVSALFQHARRLFADRPLALGCMRPAGRYGRAVERLALRAGFDAVAFPSEQTLAAACQMGFSGRFNDTCCALTHAER